MKKRVSFQPRFWISAIIVLVELLCVIAVFVLLIIYPFWNNFMIIPLIILLVLDTVLALFIANSKAEAAFKISWLVIVMVLPFAGAVIYLLFANKITTKKSKTTTY